jgi:hypothetical protein
MMNPTRKRRSAVLRNLGRAGIAFVALLGVLWMLGPPPLRSGPYVQNVTTNSAVIARFDPEPTRVRIRLSPEPGPDATVTETAPTTHHELRLHGLAPHTRYRYTVEDLDASGAVLRRDEGSFVTAPEDDTTPVRFVAVGDTGKVPGWWRVGYPFGWTRALVLLEPFLRPFHHAQWEVAEGIEKVQPEFLLHLGDVAYPRGELDYYEEALFLPFDRVIRHAATFPVLGNHDTRTHGGAPYLEVFDLPRSPSGGERYYTYRWGAVRFVMLDTTRAEPAAPGSEMAIWLAETLAAAEEPWLIVASHHPVFCSSRYADNEQLERDLWPVLVEHRVDLLLSGHSHDYMRFRPVGGVTQIISGGGGHSIYAIKPDPRLEAQAEEFGFLVLDVQGPVLTAEWIDRNGTTVDRFVLDHRESSRVPADSPRGRRIAALVAAAANDPPKVPMK